MYSNVVVVGYPLISHKLSPLPDNTTPFEFRQFVREVILHLGYEVLRDLPPLSVRRQRLTQNCAFNFLGKPLGREALLYLVGATRFLGLNDHPLKGGIRASLHSIFRGRGVAELIQFLDCSLWDLRDDCVSRRHRIFDIQQLNQFMVEGSCGMPSFLSQLSD
jgi:hypothetical protein